MGSKKTLSHSIPTSYTAGLTSVSQADCWTELTTYYITKQSSATCLFVISAFTFTRYNNLSIFESSLIHIHRAFLRTPQSVLYFCSVFLNQEFRNCATAPNTRKICSFSMYKWSWVMPKYCEGVKLSGKRSSYCVVDETYFLCVKTSDLHCKVKERPLFVVVRGGPNRGFVPKTNTEC